MKYAEEVLLQQYIKGIDTGHSQPGGDPNHTKVVESQLRSATHASTREWFQRWHQVSERFLELEFLLDAETLAETSSPEQVPRAEVCVWPKRLPFVSQSFSAKPSPRSRSRSRDNVPTKWMPYGEGECWSEAADHASLVQGLDRDEAAGLCFQSTDQSKDFDRCLQALRCMSARSSQKKGS